MENEMENYTDEQLVDTFLNFWDEVDAMNALLELKFRKNPRMEEFFKIVFERWEFDKGQEISLWYTYNENNAIDFVMQNYKDWHFRTFASLLGYLWTDSNTYMENPKKIALIKVIREHIKTFKKEEIAEMRGNYEQFMKYYKNI